MVKLVVLYKRPADPAGFDDHYFNVHVPIVRQYPGMERIEVAKVVGAPGGESDLYLIAEVYFADVAALKAALRSEPGRASAKDIATFAQGLFSLHIAEVL